MEEQSFLDRGISKVKSVVSEVSIEQRDFTKSFIRVCKDGYDQGWHESNGGNLSYRLSAEELASCRSYFNEVPGPWTPFGVRAEGLRGECFMVTASGSSFRTIEKESSSALGIIEVSPEGDAWRSVWGFKSGGRPTSELVSHFMIHAVRKGVSQDTDRVVYHTHPENIVALTAVLTPDSAHYSNVLWKSLTESILVAPSGVGVSAWRVPGSNELAEETGTLMEQHAAVLWPHHGLLCSGSSLEAAFGLTHTLEKAAAIYLKAKSATNNPHLISNKEVQAAAQAFGVQIDTAILD